jgi:two-component system, NarL family, nitrate/nitrite response regulator NarL
MKAVSTMPEQTRTSVHPLRVVIADDHVMVRDGLRRLLQDAGLNVIGQACDGMEAVMLVRQLKPDILLLDLSMPKHPGLETLRELKNSKDSVRVLLLTAAAENAEIVELSN